MRAQVCVHCQACPGKSEPVDYDSLHIIKRSAVKIERSRIASWMPVYFAGSRRKCDDLDAVLEHLQSGGRLVAISRDREFIVEVPDDSVKMTSGSCDGILTGISIRTLGHHIHLSRPGIEGTFSGYEVLASITCRRMLVEMGKPDAFF